MMWKACSIQTSRSPKNLTQDTVLQSFMPSMGAAALGASIFGYTAAVRRWTTASCMLAKIDQHLLRHGKVAKRQCLPIAWTAFRKANRHCHRHASDTTLGVKKRARATGSFVYCSAVYQAACRWYLHYCTCLHLRIQRVMCARPFQCAGEQVPKSEQSCLTESSSLLMSSECWGI